MKKSISPAAIKAIDKSGVLELLLDFPDHLLQAKEIACSAKVILGKNEFNKVVFCGVGGSGIGADFVRSYLYDQAKIPFLIVRDYYLPECVDGKSLVFISSYSGNSQEALECFDQAKEKKAEIICLSSGGRLKELAQAGGLNFVQLPKGLLPRFTFAFSSIIPLWILARAGLIKGMEADFKEAVDLLIDLKNNCLKPSIAAKDNIAKAISRKIFNKAVFIYTASRNFDVAAMRLRAQIAENAKAMASVNFLPEFNHNEIVAWLNPAKVLKNCAVIFLKDRLMDGRILKSMEFSAGVIKGEDCPVLEIASRGNGLLARMFSLIYIGDFISFYLAALYGVDPAPIERIDYLKKSLAQ